MFQPDPNAAVVANVDSIGLPEAANQILHKVMKQDLNSLRYTEETYRGRER